MDERRVIRPGSAGFALVLIGAVGFVVSCFLPYAGYRGLNSRAFSLFRLTALGRTTGGVLASYLHMFGAIAVIGVTAASGLVRPRGWTAPALVGASIVWSLTWVGSLLGQIGFLDGLKVGVWLLFLSVLVVATGAAMLLLSGRERERATETSPPEPLGTLRP